jgi:hypothetical protein
MVAVLDKRIKSHFSFCRLITIYNRLSAVYLERADFTKSNKDFDEALNYWTIAYDVKYILYFIFFSKKKIIYNKLDVKYFLRKCLQKFNYRITKLNRITRNDELKSSFSLCNVFKISRLV